MEFVTIHELSRELNVPARVIRYRLILLIAEGKLKENEDFRRDDFKDDQHFVWKINPLSFMRLTNLKPDIPVTKVPVPLVTAGIKMDMATRQCRKKRDIAAFLCRFNMDSVCDLISHGFMLTRHEIVRQIDGLSFINSPYIRGYIHGM